MMQDLTAPLLNTSTAPLQSVPTLADIIPAQAVGKPACPFGSTLMSLFFEAQSYRRPYEDEMTEAYWAARNQYSPNDLCKIKDGNTMYAGLFSQQLSTYQAWVLDRISQTERLFTVNPTPSPNVPDRYKQKVVAKVIRELRDLNYLTTAEAETFGKARLLDMKIEITDILFADAKRAAEQMQKTMDDVADEGGFRKAYLQFHEDTFKSLGVMKFPCVEEEQRIAWAHSGAATVKSETVMKFKRVSPLDFYWSPDSTTTQDGRYLIEHMRLPQESLRWMKDRAKGIVAESVDYVLSQPNLGATWMASSNTNVNESAQEQKVSGFAQQSWVAGTYDTLAFYTKLPGRLLHQYGVTSYTAGKKTADVDADKVYNVEAWVIASNIVYLTVNAHPTGKRPFYTASYEPVAGQLYGVSAWKKIRAWEIAYRNIQRHMLKAAAFQSGVIGEIDTGRFAPNQSPKSLEPWSLYPVDADYSGGGQTALRIHQMPQTLPQLRTYSEYLEQEAQRSTGIYNTMGGSAAYGTTARTRFGVETVDSNSTKIVFGKAEVIDLYAMGPMFAALYDYLMLYSEDESIKADAQVVIRGVTSVSTKQAATQTALQLLQYLPSLLSIDQSMNTHAVPPSLIQSLFKQIATGLGANTTDMPDPVTAQSAADSQDPALQPAEGSRDQVAGDISGMLPSTQIRVRPTPQ